MKSENERLQGYLYTINEDDKRSCSIMLSIEKQRTNETGTNIKKTRTDQYSIEHLKRICLKFAFPINLNGSVYLYLTDSGV